MSSFPGLLDTSEFLDSVVDDADKKVTDPDMIDVEVNLLRFPVFVLCTRGLKSVQSVACQGNFGEKAIRKEYYFRTSHLSGGVYPGPLARSAHFALLRILADRKPFSFDPITCTWQGLCRRIDLHCSGRVVQRLKAVIRAMAGLTIHSQHAFCVDNREETMVASTRRLYDKVVFYGEKMPDGTVARRNHFWMSSWYLKNINSGLTMPLNYQLWRKLDKKSRVASRLYELILPFFYDGRSNLTMRYSQLASALPVRQEVYFSDVKKQIGPSLKFLSDAGIIRGSSWIKLKTRSFRVCVTCGPKLDSLVEKGSERADTAMTALSEFIKKERIFGLAKE